MSARAILLRLLLCFALVLNGVAPAMASICQLLALVPCLTVLISLPSAAMSALSLASSSLKLAWNALSVMILSPIPGVSRIETTPIPLMHWQAGS